MHDSSMKLMKKFIDDYIDGDDNDVVFDIGSLDINGSYKELMPEGTEYVGVDIVEGKNVDVVVDEYGWSEAIPHGTADVVISGQTFNHMTDPFIGIKEIECILCNEGILCIIVPEAQVTPAKQSFTLEKLEQLLENTSLNLLKCECVNGNLILIAEKNISRKDLYDE